ncbi:hypothetical protein SAP269_02190 [Spiroplasma ixodetis]|uniref:Transmembrane protein n=1 Tax=Spiroplasma ixodetis TaxID=2141 RepID=A0ABM8JKA9_9MOLU
MNRFSKIITSYSLFYLYLKITKHITFYYYLFHRQEHIIMQVKQNNNQVKTFNQLNIAKDIYNFFIPKNNI